MSKQMNLFGKLKESTVNKFLGLFPNIKQYANLPIEALYAEVFTSYSAENLIVQNAVGVGCSTLRLLSHTLSDEEREVLFSALVHILSLPGSREILGALTDVQMRKKFDLVSDLETLVKANEIVASCNERTQLCCVVFTHLFRIVKDSKDMVEMRDLYAWSLAVDQVELTDFVIEFFDVEENQLLVSSYYNKL